MTKLSTADIMNSSSNLNPSSILSKRNNFSSTFVIDEKKTKGKLKKISLTKLKDKNTRLNSGKVKPIPKTRSNVDPSTGEKLQNPKLNKMSPLSTITRAKEHLNRLKEMRDMKNAITPKVAKKSNFYVYFI